MHEDDRNPPTITISNPDNPGLPVDLLGSGSEREPWRPSRRHWQVLLVVLLVLAAAVPPVLVLRHRDAERALGRQAIAALSLTLPPLPGEFGSGPDVPLTLSNDGPDPVEVLTVRVDRDGYRSQPVGVTVAADQLGPQLRSLVQQLCPPTR